MIKELPITNLHPHPDNPRKQLGDLTELAGSIGTFGVLQNLTVVPAEDGDGYTIVCGHRRYAAAKKAGLKQLPCIIAEDMDRRTQVSVMLLENMQRSALSYQEEAQGFQMMLDLGDSISGIAEQTGFSETKVRHRVKLNELDQALLSKKMNGYITINDLIKLEQIHDPKRRNECLEAIGTNNFDWKVRGAVQEEQKERMREQLRNLIPDLEFTTSYWKYEEVCSISINASAECIEAFTKALLKKRDAGKEIYVWIGYGDDVRGLTAKAEEGETPKEDPEQNRTYQEKEKRLRKLRGMSDRIRSAHEEFIRSISDAKAAASMDVVMEYLAEGIAGGMLYNWSGDKKLYDLLGGDYPVRFQKCEEEAMEVDADETELYYSLGKAAAAEHKDRVLLIAAYLIFLEGLGDTVWDYNGAYNGDQGLQRVLFYLGELGYEISDEEAAFATGDSELFLKEETE